MKDEQGRWREATATKRLMEGARQEEKAPDEG